MPDRSGIASSPGGERRVDKARPGEIILREATRSFEIRGDHAGTLKGRLIGRRAQGPPPVPALQGVNLRIEPGETVGMVGRNGAGKSSTLRVLAGIVPLDSGEVHTGGRIVSLLELGAGFSRDFTGRENILLQGALYGFSRAQVESRIESIIAFSELGSFIDVPVKTYSTGMFVRLGFSIATHLDADTMLIDEVLAVGDEAFQRKCLARIAQGIAAGATLVLVSHDPGQIERVCRRVVVLDGGRVIFDGPTGEGLLHYHRLMGTEHEAARSIRPAGKRALEVMEVELAGADGHRTEVYRPGSSLTVSVRLSARAPVDQPALALEIRGFDNTRLFTTTLTLPPAEAGPELTARYRIDRLALLAGDYSLLLAAGEGDAAPEITGDRVIRFTVTAEPDELAGRGDFQGPCDLRGRWQVEPAARSAQAAGAGR